jgi:hypothetical protein
MFTVANESELPERGPGGNAKWKQIIAEVKKHPDVWLKLDQKVVNTSSAYALRRYGVEVRVRNSEPDGYTIFVRFPSSKIDE